MMRRLYLSAAVGILATLCTASYGHNFRDIPLNPGERLISVNGVPVAGSSGAGSSDVASSSKQIASTQRIGEQANIIGKLARTGLPFSHSPGNSALAKANHERAVRGLGTLRPDPALQSLALQKAKIAAARSFKNHIGGSLGGAKCEGVGHTQGRFLTCCLDEPGAFGGAAMVQGRDGWYCCLLVR